MNNQNQQNIQRINEISNTLRNQIQNQMNTQNQQYVKKDEITNTMKIEQILQKQEIQQLESWTSKKCSEVLFDSNIHNWSKGTSVFNEKIEGKEKLLFVIEDERGYKFGYYLNTKIQPNKYDSYVSTDKNTFLFSLKYPGRNNGMMKFDIKQTQCGSYLHDGPSSGYLIHLTNCGGIHLRKEHEKSNSYCCQRAPCVDYKGIENALIPNSNEKAAYFTPKRITVIQMI